MPIPDQLEIITAAGAVEFYTLDRAKGITNVGRHPDNDIVIDSPNVPLFHAVLDHRHRPYHVMILGEETETRLDGRRLAPNVSSVLPPSGTLEVDGHTLILVEGSSTGVGQAAAAPAAGPQPAPAPQAVPRPAPAPVVTAPVPAAPPAEASFDFAQDRPFDSAQEAPPAPRPAGPQPRLAARPTDQPDECIIVELSEREWTIDVEQTAAFTVTLVNGGPIVATFFVGVEWVGRSAPATGEGAPEWVDIIPAQVNLNEGERETVTISVTPPRHPSSRAGAHHLAVVVTSTDYPGRFSRMGATLFINPYYEFGMGELSPKQQTLGGRKRSGEAVFHIANKGNCEATFRLEATDDERACSFEFRVPGETASLARQAETRLPPEETFAIPVKITPLSRPLIALRKRRHSFTVSAAMLEGQLAPRSLLGEVRVRPLIGPLLLALLAISLFTLMVLIFRPRIDFFEYQHEGGEIHPGDAVTLTWQASPFTRLSIEEAWLETGGGRTIRLERDERQRDVNPEQDTKYTLIGRNLLSDLLGFLPLKVENQLDTVVGDGIIDVVPLRARIIRFAADREEIVIGDSATLTWEVSNADEIILEINGVEQPMDPEEPQATKTYQPTAGVTTYILKVKNRHTASGEWDDQRAIDVTVARPTATPLPEPRLIRFDVSPREIYAGESVTITWEVEQAKLVQVVGGPSLEESNSLSGYSVQTLNQIGAVSYRLIAIYGDNTGEQEANRLESTPIVVTVREKPTPTPEPQTPEITSFKASPGEVTQGETARLVWTVNGEMDRVEISYSTLGDVIWVSTDPSGSARSPHVDTVGAHTYFLTVFNDDVSANQSAILTVNPLPPPTPTPLPPPVIDRFIAVGASSSDVVDSVDENADLIVYRVIKGTMIKLTWSVRNAESATLYRDNNPIGNLDVILPDGDYPEPDAITQLVTYRLEATNPEGIVARRRIRVELLGLRPPPPPYHVDGTLVSTDTVQITWEWTRDPDLEYPLNGFVVHRAGPPYIDFTDVARLDYTPCPCQWQETISPSCGYAYYVTGTYTDTNRTLQETVPSPERYYTDPCETSTP